MEWRDGVTSHPLEASDLLGRPRVGISKTWSLDHGRWSLRGPNLYVGGLNATVDLHRFIHLLEKWVVF